MGKFALSKHNSGAELDSDIKSAHKKNNESYFLAYIGCVSK